MKLFTKKIYIFIVFSLFIFFVYPNLSAKQINFRDGWLIISSAKVKSQDREISALNSKIDLTKWYKARVPSTVLSTLIDNGEYKDIYYNRNLDKVDRKRFSVSWWYRKDFIVKGVKGKNYTLTFDGINYRADVFLNGIKVGDSKDIFGAFKIFNLNITNNIKKGRNIIAVKIYPPEKGVYSIGFVDWNPNPPDKNLGIWRTVKLKETNSASLSNIYVKPYLDTEKLDGGIDVYGKIKNYSNKKISGKISCYVKETGMIVGKNFELAALQEKRVQIAHFYFPKPKLWWPHTLGNPYLYNLELKTFVDEKLSDMEKIRFGIRKIEDYMTKDGFRGYKVNGKKILLKGGGWVDDLTLSYDKKNIKTQIQYIKDMNLNTIRFEGFWGNSQYMYDLADENGLLIMIGFTCHWEWDNYLGIPVDENFNGTKDKTKQKVLNDYLINQIIWLRNHPSVSIWAVGSDKIPFPELEKKYVEILNKYDGTRPYIAGTKEFTSKISGKTGIKMRGPYALTAPGYWYEDTKNGGAFGFNSETGPGAQIPVLENLKKMIPKDKLWPINREWDYHCARNEFKDISRYVKALNNRYGKSANLKEFVKKSQMMNYELIRPMFEAFSVNKFKATGIIQWMLNSAWPEMFWQLYDWYLVPTGAYYGTKEGAKPLHIVYRYGFNDIWCVNDKLKNQDNLKAVVKIFDKSSKLVFDKNIRFNIISNKSIPLKINIGKYIKANKLSFISLKLYRGGREIDSNFYWVSNKMDVLDYDKTDWLITPIKDYADLTALNSLSKAKLEAAYKIKRNLDNTVELVIKNKTNKIAFFIDVKVLDENGEYIIPVSLSENYFSVLPSGERKISFKIDKIDSNEKFSVFIEGWNTNSIKFENIKL